MKIISKRGSVNQPVDITVDLGELDDDEQPFLPKDAPDQQEFEFYTEDWVIQGAQRLGAYATFDLHTGVYTVTYHDRLVARVTDLAARTYGHLLLELIRDTIELIQAETP